MLAISTIPEALAELIDSRREEVAWINILCSGGQTHTSLKVLWLWLKTIWRQKKSLKVPLMYFVLFQSSPWMKPWICCSPNMASRHDGMMDCHQEEISASHALAFKPHHSEHRQLDLVFLKIFRWRLCIRQRLESCRDVLPAYFAQRSWMPFNFLDMWLSNR